ncbi:AMP-binding protein [Actinomadura atramentaria]|uniref:AMP-binding protein n=1 Tax=Actinomadura atramentaria TaxID=1990 RepID=UPI00036D9B61|nr:AMP-binding protein [Actinomadura atramentaria]
MSAAPSASLWGGPSAAPCLVDALLETAAGRPDATALVDGDRAFTYAELYAWAAGVRDLLADRGVAPGDRVAVCAPRGAAAVAAMLGAILRGATYVPLDPEYPVRRLEHMVADCTPRLLLSHGDTPYLGESVPIPGPDVRAEPATRPCDPDLAVYIIYTSGSTGWPKGVTVGHRCLDTMVGWQAGHSPRPDLRTAQFAPLNFDVSFQEVLGTLRGGGTLVIMPERLRREPVELLSWLGEHRVERLFLPYLALQMLGVAARGDLLAGLRLVEVNTAGEQMVCTPEIRALFAALPGCRLVNHYGQSESAMVTSHILGDDPEDWPALPPIGVPLPGCEVLVDPADPDDPAVGELLVAGDPVSAGYLNRPELTERRYVEIPESPAGNTRAFRTGDLVEIKDGRVRFLTRLDDEVKLRGIRVDLLEVDAQLLADPAVAAAASTIVTTRSGAPSLRAALVTRGDPAELDVPATLERLRAALPEVSVPRSLTVVPELPRTPSGKIDRDAVAALILKELTSSDRRAGRSR